MLFSDFDLNPQFVNELSLQGITTPTPVQAQAIPIIAEGFDLIATAQTGTGKTLGFTLPSLSKLMSDELHHTMMLILVPTRELAVQVHTVVNKFAKILKIRSAAVFGGVGIAPQTHALRTGCGIVVATPGRLLDHIQQKNVNFKNLKVLVLDEADHMLDMGFLPDVRKIVAHLPKNRQTLMFSATFAEEIAALAKEMLKDPKRISVGPASQPIDTVRQIVYPVKAEDKSELLLRILKHENPTSALIFTRTKHRTDRVGKMLSRSGHSAAVIHGNRTQGQRQHVLNGFKAGQIRLLVATDVASRGIDVSGISHVINFDIPESPDAYVHRIGRTGRAHASGEAITLVTPEDRHFLRDIEKRIGQSLTRKNWEKAPSLASSSHSSAPTRQTPLTSKQGLYPKSQKKKSEKHPNPHKFSSRSDSAHSFGRPGKSKRKKTVKIFSKAS